MRGRQMICEPAQPGLTRARIRRVERVRHLPMMPGWRGISSRCASRRESARFRLVYMIAVYLCEMSGMQPEGAFRQF